MEVFGFLKMDSFLQTGQQKDFSLLNQDSVKILISILAHPMNNIYTLICAASDIISHLYDCFFQDQPWSKKMLLIAAFFSDFMMLCLLFFLPKTYHLS
ncbi:hypothetical protein J437_LFUL007143 [Ladona fulva]|uniref:Uncharacterized protein n=1 Tax=Ladona fulva TaxID=123851 RepID=A0A8K0K8V9_LADFU|nr:hypothetical protein J437_LFUL007143 [Ladona fulva]